MESSDTPRKSRRVTTWFREHQLVAFFSITFLVTWGLGFSYGAVMRQGRYVLLPLVFVATCGPALAGIIVKIIAGAGPPRAQRRAGWIAFAIAWMLSALVGLANFVFVNGASLSPALVGIVLVAVIPVAFIVNMVYSRFPVIRQIQFLPPLRQGSLRWVFVGVILLPGLALISVGINILQGKASGVLPALPATGITLVTWIVLKFLYQFFFFNGTGEEVGWRGFALPRLQLRLSPLVASLLLSLFWVPWHVFLWRAEGQPIDTWNFWLVSYFLHIPAGVIICWIFNRSQGSVLVAGIAHAAANTALGLLQGFDPVALALTFYGFAVVIVVTDRMWRKLPVEHPAVFHDRDLGGGPGANTAPAAAATRS